MTYLSTLIDNVQDWLEDNGDEEEVIRAINRAIRQVETFNDWEALRDSVTVTPDSSGVILDPPTSRVVTRVVPVGSYDLPEYDFRPKARQDQLNRPVTNERKLLAYPSIKTQLSQGLTVDVTQSNQTITQATSSTDDIEASWVGERFMLEGDETVYEITAAVAATSMTVFPDVRRDTGTAVAAKVRPLGQKQFQLTDSVGKGFTAAVTAEYQRQHPPLSIYTDQLWIPAEFTVTLIAVKFFLHQTKYDVDARQLQIDITEARDRECNQEATAYPESINVKQTFSVRSGRGNGTLR